VAAARDADGAEMAFSEQTEKNVADCGISVIISSTTNFASRGSSTGTGAMQREPGRHSKITSFRFGELPRHYRELLRTPSATSGWPNLHATFSELLNHLAENLRFDHIGFALHDPARDVVSVILQAGEHQFPAEIPVLKKSLGVVLHDRKAIEVQDVETETEFDDLVNSAKSGGFRSFRIVPLTTERQTLGSLAVVRREPGAFSEQEARYLDNAAQLVALVLENALMADVMGREKAHLETLVDVNSALVRSLNVQKLFQDVSTSIRRIVSHDYAHLSLYDKSCDMMRLYVLDFASQPVKVMPEALVPLSECAAGMTFLQGETMVFRRADLQSIGSDYTRGLLELGVRSMCWFPLKSRGRKLGALGFASLREDAAFEDDLPFLTQVATQVAMAVDNARAYEEIARFKDKLAKEKLYLEEEMRSQNNFGEVVGNSPALREVLQQVEIAAPSDATVLVLGETGTGKELIARALHRLSSRREGNFIKLNCAAIPSGLLESELFGHEKGAFTGAVSQKIGRLELADKGTLFLDEIGEIAMELQPKLLRVLQDHEFERLGGVKTIRVNIRLIAATNRDLAQAVDERQFRSDLFYRLNVFPIRLPPLRERAGDIPMLVRYFVQKLARRMSKNIDSIPAELLREFEKWHWPGNVRELENFIERSIILTQGSVLFAPVAELRIDLAHAMRKSGSTLEDVEREYILRTLRESGGVIAGIRGAAARLGMKRTTLQSKMHRLGITRDEYET
jgi:formate hydrogenlyase transcriptional activator